METSGSALASGGVTELKKYLEKLKEGGVLFLDEVRHAVPAVPAVPVLLLHYKLSRQDYLELACGTCA